MKDTMKPEREAGMREQESPIKAAYLKWVETAGIDEWTCFPWEAWQVAYRAGAEAQRERLLNYFSSPETKAALLKAFESTPILPPKEQP